MKPPPSVWVCWDTNGKRAHKIHFTSAEPTVSSIYERYDLARPAAKSEIAKAIADATLRANRRAARILLHKCGPVNNDWIQEAAIEIMGKRRKK